MKCSKLWVLGETLALVETLVVTGQVAQAHLAGLLTCERCWGFANNVHQSEVMQEEGSSSAQSETLPASKHKRQELMTS